MSDDGSGLLTLHEAADRLGVHYMTVYGRRLGMLPARKVAGTWRVDPADLTATRPRPVPPRHLRERVGAPTATTSGGVPRGPIDSASGCWPATPSGAGRSSSRRWRRVSSPLTSTSSPGTGPAWDRRRLAVGVDPVEREHIASGVAAKIVGRLGPRFRRRGRHLGSVVIAMPVGERHGLGVAMLADIVAQAGYDVLNVGADTPPSSLASAIRSRDDLRAIVISVVDATNLPAAARMIAAARRADRAVLIVAGGFAVPDRRPPGGSERTRGPPTRAASRA